MIGLVERGASPIGSDDDSDRSTPVHGLVLNFRDARRTIACVRSLLAAGIDRILVWDNSADGGNSAAGVATTFAGDRRVLLAGRDANLGFAAGVNAGLAHWRAINPAAWVLLINNDAIFPASELPRMIADLRKDPSAALAFPAVRQQGRVQSWLHHQRWLALVTQRPVPGSFPYVSGCCQLLAMDRLPLPLYDETFFMYGEDIELSWRLANSGWRLLYVDGQAVEHEGSASSGIGSEFYERHIVLSHLSLAFRLSPRRTVQAMLFVSRATGLALRALVRSIRYRTLSPMAAFAWAFSRATRTSAQAPAAPPPQRLIGGR